MLRQHTVSQRLCYPGLILQHFLPHLRYSELRTDSHHRHWPFSRRSVTLALLEP